MRLAEQTGFKQAHISNFLNRKRGLSLEGMDKVLRVQHLSVLDLLDPDEVNKRASILPPSEDEFENVLPRRWLHRRRRASRHEHERKRHSQVQEEFPRSLRPETKGAARTGNASY